MDDQRRSVCTTHWTLAACHHHPPSKGFCPTEAQRLSLSRPLRRPLPRRIEAENRSLAKPTGLDRQAQTRKVNPRRRRPTRRVNLLTACRSSPSRSPRTRFSFPTVCQDGLRDACLINATVVRHRPLHAAFPPLVLKIPAPIGTPAGWQPGLSGPQVFFYLCTDAHDSAGVVQTVDGRTLPDAVSRPRHSRTHELFIHGSMGGSQNRNRFSAISIAVSSSAYDSCSKQNVMGRAPTGAFRCQTRRRKTSLHARSILFSISVPPCSRWRTPRPWQ